MSDENRLPQLTAEVSREAVAALAKQRESLNHFIKTQLKKDIDYGVIPGTPKPTLLQPGAQKLANIFQLGSRIVASDTIVDHEQKFILCKYTVELFHLPTGKAIAQCEGSTNSRERKYQRQDMYSVINTLQKMAQKRAFVGAVVLATNASDFFTQDLEDMDLKPQPQPQPPTTTYAKPKQVDVDGDTQLRWGKYKNKTLDECCEDPKFLSYCEWIIEQSTGKSDKVGFLNDAQAWREFAVLRAGGSSGVPDGTAFPTMSGLPLKSESQTKSASGEDNEIPF